MRLVLQPFRRCVTQVAEHSRHFVWGMCPLSLLSERKALLTFDQKPVGCPRLMCASPRWNASRRFCHTRRWIAGRPASCKVGMAVAPRRRQSPDAQVSQKNSRVFQKKKKKMPSRWRNLHIYAPNVGAQQQVKDKGRTQLQGEEQHSFSCHQELETDMRLLTSP